MIFSTISLSNDGGWAIILITWLVNADLLVKMSDLVVMFYYVK